MPECGATEDECDFLATHTRWQNWYGQRIELNAMDSAQFIEWLEARLEEAGVEKVIRGAEVLAAYKRAVRRARVQQMINEMLEEDEEEESIVVPGGLVDTARERITGTTHRHRATPEQFWISPEPPRSAARERVSLSRARNV